LDDLLLRVILFYQDFKVKDLLLSSIQLKHSYSILNNVLTGTCEDL